MPELSYKVPTPTSLQELEKAVQRYKNSDLSGTELLSQWQAIRDASLSLADAEPSSDKVPCQDSY